MSVMLAQIAWNGTVSQPGYMKIRTRLPSAKTTHNVSSTPGDQGQPSRLSKRGCRGARITRGTVAELASSSLVDKLIALTPHGLDQFEAELGAEAPDAHVYHVRAGIEVVAPHGGEQAVLGHQLPGVLGELAEQQELQPGQRYRPLPDVRDQLPDVESDPAGPDHLAGRRPHVGGLAIMVRLSVVRLGAEPDVDPGEQLGEGERLGEVVLRAALEQVDLRGHVGDAGQHDHGLVGVDGKQLAEELTAVYVGYHEVEGDTG